MNKKAVVAIIVLLFALPMLLQFVLAQEQIPGIPAGLTPEQVEAQIAKAQNVTEWQMIGQRFQQALLKNPVIISIDSFCKQISIVFSILFGMPYSLSITLLFVMAMWLIVAIDFGNIISSYSTLSKLASYGISFAFAVMFAQLQVFRFIVDYTGTLIYSKEAWWARALLIFAVILLIIFVDRLSRYIARYLKGLEKLREETRTKVAQKTTQEFAKGIERGLKS